MASCYSKMDRRRGAWLEGVRPPIWRGVPVSAGIRLNASQDLIQIAMGWRDLAGPADDGKLRRAASVERSRWARGRIPAGYGLVEMDPEDGEDDEFPVEAADAGRAQEQWPAGTLG